jgi:hypothetical protein
MGLLTHARLPAQPLSRDTQADTGTSRCQRGTRRLLHWKRTGLARLVADAVVDALKDARHAREQSGLELHKVVHELADVALRCVVVKNMETRD